MKKIEIKDSVFKTAVVFIYNCSQKELNKYLKSVGAREIEEKDNTLGCLCRTKEGIYRIIYVEKFNKKNVEDNAVLIHELFHLVIRICEDKGVPNVSNIQTGDCGDETGAYLIEFYYNSIINKVK